MPYSTAKATNSKTAMYLNLSKSLMLSDAWHVYNFFSAHPESRNSANNYFKVFATCRLLLLEGKH